MGFQSWLVYSRLKLFQLLGYLRFDGIGRLLGNLLRWISALFGGGCSIGSKSDLSAVYDDPKTRPSMRIHFSSYLPNTPDKWRCSTYDFNFPAAESTTAPISASTLAALISASPSFWSSVPDAVHDSGLRASGRIAPTACLLASLVWCGSVRDVICDSGSDL